MKLSTRRSLHWFALACLCALSFEARAQDISLSDQATQVHIAVHRDASDDKNDNNDNNDILTVGGNSTLAKGKSADSVVSILGSSTSEGDVGDSVVSVAGNSRVTGPVGDSVVAVAGEAYVNSKVHGDVVAVLGNIELGPQADIGGDVTAVGGVVRRDPAAVVHGQVQNVLIGVPGAFSWLHPWVQHCLLYGRPLAFAPGLGWAWGIALGFLALYLVLSLVFRGAVDRCVETLETQPGQSLLAALLTMLLIPVVIIILCITIVGIAVLPFLMLGLFCAGLFGRTIVLAVLGRRVTKLSDATANTTLLAVLVGGVIVLGLYLIPFLGFLIYTVLGIVGLGVVIYTLILAARRSSTERIAATAAAAPTSAARVAPDVAAQSSSANTAGSEPLGRSEPPPLESSQASTTTAAASAAPPAANAADASVLPRAGFWIRMGALLIDALLVGIVLGMLWHHSSRMELLTLAAYGAIMWKIKGTTIGGTVFNLKVVRVDGRPIDWATAIVRALGCFLSLAVVGLGFLWIVFDDGKQAWHDKIAGTMVVRLPKGVSLL
jgi:uncharacterized RDD family membrane protein YckC